MRAITADIYTRECSAIADELSFGALPENLLLITEDQWAAEPQPEQIWAGNIPATFVDPPPPPVPESITNRQARLALLFAGKLDDVEAAINGIEDPMTRSIVRIEWDSASTIRRDHQWVAGLAAALGMTAPEIDQLFITGASFA